MAVTEPEFERAGERTLSEREAGHVLSARYERRGRRVILRLNTGVEVAFPTALAEGLAGAAPEDLERIEISPTGLGLHWPRLDADLYVPALLRGVFGSRSWMAAPHGRRRRQGPVGRQGGGRAGERPQRGAAAQPGRRYGQASLRRVRAGRKQYEVPDLRISLPGSVACLSALPDTSYM